MRGGCTDCHLKKTTTRKGLTNETCTVFMQQIKKTKNSNLPIIFLKLLLNNFSNTRICLISCFRDFHNHRMAKLMLIFLYFQINWMPMENLKDEIFCDV